MVSWMNCYVYIMGFLIFQNVLSAISSHSWYCTSKQLNGYLTRKCNFLLCFFSPVPVFRFVPKYLCLLTPSTSSPLIHTISCCGTDFLMITNKQNYHEKSRLKQRQLPKKHTVHKSWMFQNYQLSKRGKVQQNWINWRLSYSVNVACFPASQSAPKSSSWIIQKIVTVKNEKISRHWPN